ncbi:GTP cyclohydrolase I FolE [Apibacter adventoris]|uniref:GTP cyclohydrolase 1 n=1 Tax=Apibacter adventoris TaxID=1679466 RepID=A0A2S8AET0_9FLAO|nr:GTP cyclohydrolase I FolE [Apibacter adventoris]PQL94104.1 GTP cyclohydrolase I FolE [Apibacter adventoris]
MFTEDEDIDHLSNAEYTPIRKDAFEMPIEKKQELIQDHFTEIMKILGLDMNDDSLKDTPKRVAKMYVKEIFGGLLPENKPSISTFENTYKYRQMLIEKDITVYSTCEHHFLPIIGRAHVAYISNGTVIGLSKINRIVNYYARRPQVQERLTRQIVKAMSEALNTKDVACVIDAKHLCINSRGIQDTNSSTVTAELSGMFRNNPTTRKEFLHYIGIDSHFKI